MAYHSHFIGIGNSRVIRKGDQNSHSMITLKLRMKCDSTNTETSREVSPVIESVYEIVYHSKI